MSATGYCVPSARWGQRMFDGKMVDMMVNDGLWDAFNNYHMGMTAENVAEQWGITREELDEFSLASQQKAEAAIKSGRFKDEIVPVEVPQRKGDPIVFDTDEHPKFGSSLEKMAKLKPAFKKDGGVVTAANASGINDSGAAVVVMSADKAKELGIKPMFKIVSYASAGVDPKIMGTGPIPASRKALAKAGLEIKDMTEDAEVLITGYGISGRIARSAVRDLRAEGYKIGLIRPRIISPFPYHVYENIDFNRVHDILDVEMSIPAQFVWDVKMAVKDRAPVTECLRSGGEIISKEQIMEAARGLFK